ncbi:hypothetical protein CVT24_001781 [Panaeolus cyanescens]|uniref:Uncharacterized protein n=1 Tax=Panaeolus cyanescens TaxID=181874 RepID=A0A409YFU1_9AGAR|nr:hypothetical protein CVT24_001781 [Panaeolus cyanescens]
MDAPSHLGLPGGYPISTNSASRQNSSNFSSDLREPVLASIAEETHPWSIDGVPQNSMWNQPWAGVAAVQESLSHHNDSDSEVPLWGGFFEPDQEPPVRQEIRDAIVAANTGTPHGAQDSDDQLSNSTDDFDNVVGPSFMNMRLTSTPPPTLPEPYHQNLTPVRRHQEIPQAEPKAKKNVKTLAQKAMLTNATEPWSVNELQEEVRRHVALLAGVYSPTDPRSKKVYPAAHELDVKTFNANRSTANGPTLNNFRIDMKHPRGKWNKHLAVLFCSNFRTAMKARNPVFSKLDDDLLTEVFLTHMKTLKTSKTTMDRAPEVIKQVESANNQKQRKTSLAKRRLEGAMWAAALDPNLVPLVDFLQSLPRRVLMDCQSDDESDHVHEEEVNRKYWVRPMAWRSPQLVYLLRLLDCFHMATRFTGNGRASRGAWPHPRTVCSSRKSYDLDPPEGLPSNMYSPVWLSTKEPGYIAQLKMQPPLQLQISPHVLNEGLRYKPKLEDKNAPLLPKDHPSLHSTTHPLIILPKSPYDTSYATMSEDHGEHTNAIHGVETKLSNLEQLLSNARAQFENCTSQISDTMKTLCDSIHLAQKTDLYASLKSIFPKEELKWITEYFPHLDSSPSTNISAIVQQAEKNCCSHIQHFLECHSSPGNLSEPELSVAICAFFLIRLVAADDADDDDASSQFPDSWKSYQPAVNNLWRDIMASSPCLKACDIFSLTIDLLRPSTWEGSEGWDSLKDIVMQRSDFYQCMEQEIVRFRSVMHDLWQRLLADFPLVPPRTTAAMLVHALHGQTIVYINADGEKDFQQIRLATRPTWAELHNLLKSFQEHLDDATSQTAAACGNMAIRIKEIQGDGDAHKAKLTAASQSQEVELLLKASSTHSNAVETFQDDIDFVPPCCLMPALDPMPTLDPIDGQDALECWKDVKAILSKVEQQCNFDDAHTDTLNQIFLELRDLESDISKSGLEFNQESTSGHVIPLLEEHPEDVRFPRQNGLKSRFGWFSYQSCDRLEDVPFHVNQFCEIRSGDLFCHRVDDNKGLTQVWIFRVEEGAPGVWDRVTWGQMVGKYRVVMRNADVPSMVGEKTWIRHYKGQKPLID